MDRKAVLEKIQAMLALQSSTTHDGEYEAAANLIEKLCAKYGVSVEDAGKPIASDEQFGDSFSRINKAHAIILNAVASYYGAKAYHKQGDTSRSFQLIGTERQQLETQLYFDYVIEVMEKEATKAYAAEKVIAELTGGTVTRSFLNNFRTAFASQVSDRLFEMAEARDKDEHHEAVREALSTRRFTRGRNMRGASGAGAAAGSGIGAGVSLNRQASGGGARRALVGV